MTRSKDLAEKFVIFSYLSVSERDYPYWNISDNTIDIHDNLNDNNFNLD